MARAAIINASKPDRFEFIASRDFSTMLTIHYFASIRESLNKAQEQLELPVGVQSVSDLIRHLGASDAQFQATIANDKQVLVAVNQTVVSRDCTLGANDEVAFFPPMTGG